MHTTNYRFIHPVDAQLEFFAESVRGLQLGGFSAGAHFFNAMLALVTIEAALVRDRVDVERTARIRRVVAEALAPCGGQVRAYAQVVADQADTDSDDILPELCTRRSSLQYLFDEYRDSPAAVSIEPEDIARFDRDLRRLVSEKGALPAAEVPLGISPSHWWWYPPRDAGAGEGAAEPGM